MRRLAAALTLLLPLLAGCGEPGPHELGAPALQEPAPVGPAADAASHTVAIVVTQETPAGPPLAARVQAVPVNADGSHAPMLVVGTDTQGAARFSFRQPTTLLVRAIGPDGWTQEGARVHVDQAVAAQGVTVSDRDVFLPLLRASITSEARHLWSSATPQPGLDGEVAPAVTTVPIAFPDGLQAAYLARLAAARVEAAWMDSADGHAASVAVGLAWDGAVWVEGNASSPVAAGERSAAWDGELPADRPADLAAATLQAALLTRTGVVGDVAFDVRTTLAFGGRVPPGMPADDCHLIC